MLLWLLLLVVWLLLLLLLVVVIVVVAVAVVAVAVVVVVAAAAFVVAAVVLIFKFHFSLATQLRHGWHEHRRRIRRISRRGWLRKRRCGRSSQTPTAPTSFSRSSKGRRSRSVGLQKCFCSPMHNKTNNPLFFIQNAFVADVRPPTSQTNEASGRKLKPTFWQGAGFS